MLLRVQRTRLRGGLWASNDDVTGDLSKSFFGDGGKVEVNIYVYTHTYMYICIHSVSFV